MSDIVYWFKYPHFAHVRVDLRGRGWILFYIYDHLFHPKKCKVIHICTNKRFRRHQTYKPHVNTLESVYGAKYLGVTLSEDLSWTPHMDDNAAKVSRTLGFLRRNMFHCTDKVRERTYNDLVLPVLTYAAAAWDPYMSRDINSLDQVQRRGARLGEPLAVRPRRSRTLGGSLYRRKEKATD